MTMAMTVSVLFFASLRELAGIERTSISCSGSVKDLVTRIGEIYGDDLASQLARDNIRVAVNQAIVPRQTLLQAGDEVAFLPPVTGG